MVTDMTPIYMGHMVNYQRKMTLRRPFRIFDIKTHNYWPKRVEQAYLQQVL